MPKTYHPLPTVHLDAGTEYFHSGDIPEVIHMDDPALDVMLDYQHVKAITISPHQLIKDAKLEMAACGVHLLLVTDVAGQVVGLISSEDILGEKPIKITEDKQISRADIKVSMVMTPQEDILAIPYEELKISKVGHVIQTIKDAKQHMALVVEPHPETGKQTVRGLYSLTQLNKRLDTNVTDYLYASSLAELKRKLDD